VVEYCEEDKDDAPSATPATDTDGERRIVPRTRKPTSDRKRHHMRLCGVILRPFLQRIVDRTPTDAVTLDLTSYMNETPFTVQPEFTMTQAFRYAFLPIVLLPPSLPLHTYTCNCNFFFQTADGQYVPDAGPAAPSSGQQRLRASRYHHPPQLLGVARGPPRQAEQVRDGHHPHVYARPAL
jgi:hypothetical protein